MKATTRVLLVENERGLLTLLSGRLRAAGYAVETARDGLKALEAIERGPPSAVVSDIDMPRLDGLSLCRLAQRIAPHMPVILMTARTDSSLPWSYEHCGAARVMRKPFDGRELIATLEMVLDRGARRRDADASG